MVVIQREIDIIEKISYVTNNWPIKRKLSVIIKLSLRYQNIVFSLQYHLYTYHLQLRLCVSFMAVMSLCFWCGINFPLSTVLLGVSVLFSIDVFGFLCVVCECKSMSVCVCVWEFVILIESYIVSRWQTRRKWFAASSIRGRRHQWYRQFNLMKRQIWPMKYATTAPETVSIHDVCV